MNMKLFIRFSAKQTRPNSHLDVPYGFLRSYSPKTSRLPTSRCHGVPQAMDESYTILVQPTGFFFSRPCAHYRLIDYKRGGSGFKKLCLAIPYNASARACRRHRLRFPPPSASASTLSFPFPSHVAPSKMGDGTTFCVLSNLRAR